MKLKAIRIAPLALLALVSTASAAEIGGRYTVVGTNLDGSKYSGAVDITIASDTRCTIVWTTGGQTLPGICMRAPGAFAAAFGTGGGAGLVLYKILPDGTLDGLWTVANKQGVGTDVLTPDRTPERMTSPGFSAHAPITSDAPITSNPPTTSNFPSVHGEYVK